MKVYQPIISGTQYNWARVFSPCSTRELARKRIEKELTVLMATTWIDDDGRERIVENGEVTDSMVVIVEFDMDDMEQTLFL